MVYEKVVSIIVDQLEIDEDKVSLSSSIQEDLGADSLDILDLIISFEEEFELDIPDESVETIKTVADVVHYIEDRIDA